MEKALGGLKDSIKDLFVNESTLPSVDNASHEDTQESGGINSPLDDSTTEKSLHTLPSLSTLFIPKLDNERSKEPSRKICILSLDGGGIRGLIAARILSRLECLLQEKTKTNARLCDYFDLFAGTSTGTLLALMLTTPDENGDPLFTAQRCCQFYAQNGKYIFHQRRYDPFRGSLRQLYRPKYSARRLERVLKAHLSRNGKDLTLKDTSKPVLLTAFDISKAVPFLFVHTAATKSESRNFRLWEVCRATVAAPTYFSPAHIASLDGTISADLIDGAVVQNNPALVAVTNVWSDNHNFPEAGGLEDILILSLGAGQLDEKHQMQKVRKWGLAAWARPLINIMMDGSADTVDYQLASAFAGYNCAQNYLRIQLSGLPHKTALMDCASKKNIEELLQLSDNLLLEKAVVRNPYGGKITVDETNEERLSWFADQLILQKELRAKQMSRSSNSIDRLVSPVLDHLLNRQRIFFP